MSRPANRGTITDMGDVPSSMSWNDDADPPAGIGLSFRTVGPDLVIEVSGELDLASAPALLDRLEAALDLAQGTTVTLDLADLDFVDSSGLHALDRARILVGERAMAFALASVPDGARRVLEVSSMEQLFEYR
jgi:anti-sigma B factor antagonist